MIDPNRETLSALRQIDYERILCIATRPTDEAGMMLDATSDSLIDTLSLPHLSFDSRLVLVKSNKAANDLFGKSTTGRHLSSILRHEDGVNAVNGEHPMMAHEIQTLAAACQLKEFGKGVRLKVWLGEGMERKSAHYQVHVQAHPDLDGVKFTLLFLRPAVSRSNNDNGSSTSSVDVTKCLCGLGGGTATEDAMDLSEEISPQTFDDLYESFKVLGPPTKLPSERLEEIINNLPQIVFSTGIDGKVIYFNDQFYEFTGIERNDAFASPDVLFSLFHPDDIAATSLAWYKSLSTGTPLRIDYRVRDRNGEFRWLATRANPVRDKNGVIESWVLTSTEIDDLVKARSDALVSAKHISAVLHGAKFSLLTVDLDSKITFLEGPLSAALPSLLSKEEYIGSDLRDAWPDVALEKVVAEMIGNAKHSPETMAQHVSIDSTLELPTGERSFRYQLVPLLENSGTLNVRCTGVIIVTSDITLSVAASIALAAATLERTKLIASEGAAQESSRLKTEFLTVISHEIRTPIACMLGVSELLLSDPLLEQSHRSLVQKSYRSGEVLLELVGMVLDVGKIEAGKLSLETFPFLIKDAVHDATLSLNLHRGVEFHLLQLPPYPTFDSLVLGDSTRLRQILTNLLSNSGKFTSEGKIELRIRKLSETAERVWMEFVVEDTGCGIDEHLRALLFIQEFVQSDSSTARIHGGSGLGLKISADLVALMGGTIEMTSQVGVGTCIRVLLSFEKSLTAGEVGGLEGVRSPRLGMDGLPVVLPISRPRLSAEIKILLAEDNELIREIITRTLRKMKFQIRAVVDGHQALEALKEERFDLILMDGQMPICDGYTTTRAIRKSAIAWIRNIKIIALTASAVKGDRQRCLEAGMNDYLSKPVRSADLEKAIWSQLSVVA